MPIRELSSELINQIAAGEVVERPAAVLRELLDNAVDAGATRIDISVEQGGIDALSVRDDGCGIAPEELALALTRHATSKIARLDDLEALRTLGFRGEALPSIAAVADLRLVSRTATAEHAWAVEVGPGRPAGAPEPARGGRGTSVEMRDLFARVPARRKFLRSPRTEWTHIEAMARRLALARPDIALSLRHNGREQWARPHETLEARVQALVGADFLAAAMRITAQEGPLRLSGYASRPAWSRVQPDTQYVFLNGRYLRDRLVVGALRAAYAEVLHGSRQPGYVLFLELPPEQVDVNVHPAKQEVRFREGQQVFRFLRGAAMQAIHSEHRAREAASMPAAGAHGGPGVGSGLTGAGATAASRSRSAPYAPAFGLGPAAGVDEPRGDWAAAAPSAEGAAARDVAALIQQMPAAAAEAAVADAPAPPKQAGWLAEQPLGTPLAQLHQAYILAQSARGLVLVDMHAAHERIVLERLKAALGEAHCVAQPLLVPLEFAARESELAAAEEAAEALQRLGLELRVCGPGRLAVQARPALLAGYDLERLVRDLLADLHAGEGADTHRLEAALDRALGNHACKAGSIKHGRRLSLPEMEALLRQIESTPRSGQCNHGRPTWREIPLDELDGWFLRGR